MSQNKLQVWAGHCLAQKRLATLAVGLTGNWAINYGFDFVLYPFMLYTFGTVTGWAIMVALSLAFSLVTVWFYDWSKKDWLGIELAKSLRDEGKLGKLTAWALQKSDPIMLVILSVQFEPVITTLYMRRGVGQYNGFSRRDWTNFSLSMLVANLYWGLVVLAGIDLVQYLWTLVS
jgi:hypothetical protein